MKVIRKTLKLIFRDKYKQKMNRMSQNRGEIQFQGK